MKFVYPAVFKKQKTDAIKELFLTWRAASVKAIP